MNLLLIYVLVLSLLVSLAAASPIHGIWAHLPPASDQQSKRNFYGAMRHGYLLEEPLDKRSAFSGVLIGPYGVYLPDDPIAEFGNAPQQ